jgi:deubiquitinating protein VCIP135
MKLRLVYADGTIAYENGDLTPTRAISSHCHCGYKHWWNGKEYDNPPDLVSVKVQLVSRSQPIHCNVEWSVYDTETSI